MLHRNFILKYLALFYCLLLLLHLEIFKLCHPLLFCTGNHFQCRQQLGLSFQEEGKRPVGNASIEELQQYDAYYAQDTDEKIFISLLTADMKMAILKLF